MEKGDILKQADRILQRFDQNGISEAIEFLRVYAGEKSSFYKGISKLNPQSFWNDGVVNTARGFMQGFRNYVENDLHQGISLGKKVSGTFFTPFLLSAARSFSEGGLAPQH